MDFSQVSHLLRSVLAISREHVVNGRAKELRNERYFHHMLSHLAALHYWPNPADAWKEILIRPEHPTRRKFRRSMIDLSDIIVTRDRAVGVGKRGNIDFALIPREAEKPHCLVEWKGPKIYTTRETVEVFLKLLTEKPSDIKVFAAIVTSGSTDRADHRASMRSHFNDALTFSVNVLGITSLASRNLFACVATIPSDGTVQEIIWGQLTAPLP
jgi:hypothetical protein